MPNNLKVKVLIILELIRIGLLLVDWMLTILKLKKWHYIDIYISYHFCVHYVNNMSGYNTYYYYAWVNLAMQMVKFIFSCTYEHHESFSFSNISKEIIRPRVQRERERTILPQKEKHGLVYRKARGQQNVK